MYLVFFTISTSCYKEAIDSAISSAFDSPSISIDAKADNHNFKQITFKVNNSSDDFETGSVGRDFRDSNKKTINSASVTQTYSKTGNYNLTAKII